MKSKVFESETNLKRQLTRSLHQMPSANDAHLQAAILQARGEVCRKQNRKRISFVHFLGKQIPVIGWKLWGIQGVFLLSAYGVLSKLSDYLISPIHLAKLLFCLSTAVFMTALPLLCKSVRYRMQEIEAAARFSSVKLLLAKLVVIGAGDACLLGGIFLCTLAKTALSADSVFFYLCFPFLLAGGGCLYLLGHFPPERFFAGSLLFCFTLMLIFTSLPGQYAFWYQSALPAVRVILCALPLAFCVRQLRSLIIVSSYEELQLN